MRIVGHGVDVVGIAEIKQELESPNKRWAQRFYSLAERAVADPPPLDSRYYAGRFAGKEAVAKALRTGFAGDITWRGIQILRHESGAPYVLLTDEVLKFSNRLGITGWFISISYCGDTATASAIAIGE